MSDQLYRIKPLNWDEENDYTFLSEIDGIEVFFKGYKISDALSFDEARAICEKHRLELLLLELEPVTSREKELEEKLEKAIEHLATAINSYPETSVQLSEARELTDWINQNCFQQVNKALDKAAKTCGCGAEARYKLLVTNIPDPRWEPHCESCYQHFITTSQEVNDHELRVNEGVYGFVTWEEEKIE